VKHSVRRRFRKGSAGLPRGYEEVNYHEQLWSDPLFGVLAGRKKVGRTGGRHGNYKKIAFSKQSLDELLLSELVGALGEGSEGGHPRGHRRLAALHILRGVVSPAPAVVRPRRVFRVAWRRSSRSFGQIRQTYPEVKIILRGDCDLCRARAINQHNSPPSPTHRRTPKGDSAAIR